MDFFNISRQEFETPAELRRGKSSRSVQQQIRRFQKGLDEIHEQEIFVPCELNNGIKELNYEILRLTDSLTRLDDRVNRKKRGVHEQTAIIDCIEMKGKFKKIYEDLNRISEILSMMDDNGICRCKCPLDKIINTTAEIVHVTDIPFDLTTFAMQNTSGKQSAPNKKTKQLKKIILSDYRPQKVANDDNDKFKSVQTDDDSAPTTGMTTYGVSQFTVIPTIEDDNTQEDETVTMADTKEDMSPEMSNAITKYLRPNGHERTTIEPPTSDHIENVTKDSTEVTDSSETIKTTRFKLEMSTTQARKLNNEGFLSSTTTYESMPESTTDFDDSKINNNYVKYKTSESTTTFENRLESTTSEASDFDDNNTNSTNNIFKSTASYQKHISESTTELSDLRENINNDKVTNRYKSTYGYENISESTTELSDLRVSENTDKVTEDFKSTYGYENDSESTTELLDSRESEYNKNIKKQALKPTTSTYENVSEFTSSSEEYEKDLVVTQKTIEQTSTNKNIKGSTTVVPMFDKNVSLKERTSSEDQSRNDNDKIKNGNVINQFDSGKLSVGNKNNSTPRDYENKSTARPGTTEQVQPKWYPVCFYPVPCSQQQNTQDVSKINTVQYSAQSLSTHKKNAPAATVIQNNYPIISYCPMGMVCSMTDSAGQSNILHCMLKPAALPDGSQNTSKNNETKWDYTSKENHDAKSSGTTNAKSARDSDEILTGTMLLTQQVAYTYVMNSKNNNNKIYIYIYISKLFLLSTQVISIVR